MVGRDLSSAVKGPQNEDEDEEEVETSAPQLFIQQGINLEGFKDAMFSKRSNTFAISDTRESEVEGKF